MLWQSDSPPPSPSQGEVVAAVPEISVPDEKLPSILSKNDVVLYHDIFRAQKRADWKSAARSIDELENKILVGYVLAERYLHKDYDSKPQELVDWLKHYGDHRQAADIYALAKRKSASLKGITIRRQAVLQGYGDDNGLSASFANSPHAVTWYKGLSAWRKGDKHSAAKIFSGLLTQQDLPRWKASAAAFWSYRAYKATGDKTLANTYLRLAAQEPRSFYGILARKQLKQSLELDMEPVELASGDADLLAAQPAVQRIIALARINRSELAEKELRGIFPQASREEKLRLLALAHELNLASVQIAMARQLGTDERPLDYARYPTPSWQPQDGFTVDSALIYAVARQESGFHTAAVSRSGALGLMQLMPKTASFMKKRMNNETQANTADPMVNIALGQNYVEHLLENPLVEGNLFYLLTAYNAGPKRLMEWKESLDYKNDPLLFAESIPYAETRNYVMQVMTNYWIYSELAGKTNPSVVGLLSGKWPDYREHMSANAG